LWAALVIPGSNLSYASDVDLSPTENQDALQKFREKSIKIQGFMSTNNLILTKYDFPKSPTGFSYSYMKVRLVNMSFDVQKSNSLISPLVGYIYLTYTWEENSQCGDLIEVSKYIKSNYGYSSYEKVLAHKQDCFRSYHQNEDGTQLPYKNQSVKLVFSYQDNHWIFKDAIDPDSNSKSMLWLTTLGKPEGYMRYLPDNHPWEDIVN
jgi:hypothetical protein